MQPGPAALGSLRPVGGRLLDLRLSWTTLTADAGESREPGYLSRLGPITPAQARHLADLATNDPAVRWRVIVTNHDNRAVASCRIRRAHTSALHQEGLISQVTVTIRQDSLTGPRELADLLPILGRLLAAARSAAARAGEQAAADAKAGRCAHTAATPAYRPSRQLTDYITARDLTCRFCTCRQPASHCDLDHTTPFDQGGVTCACNLGPGCRFHHQVKQHPGWHLDQPTPGIFIWTTPTGRKYATEPDSHAA